MKKAQYPRVGLSLSEGYLKIIIMVALFIFTLALYIV